VTYFSKLPIWAQRLSGWVPSPNVTAGNISARNDTNHAVITYEGVSSITKWQYGHKEPENESFRQKNIILFAWQKNHTLRSNICRVVESIVNRVCNYLSGAESLDANRSLASQYIPRILWNPVFYYHIHKNVLPIPILNQINPLHSPIPILED
jgi:hypothetical protein